MTRKNFLSLFLASSFLLALWTPLACRKEKAPEKAVPLAPSVSFCYGELLAFVENASTILAKREKTPLSDQERNSIMGAAIQGDGCGCNGAPLTINPETLKPSAFGVPYYETICGLDGPNDSPNEFIKVLKKNRRMEKSISCGIFVDPDKVIIKGNCGDWKPSWVGDRQVLFVSDWSEAFDKKPLETQHDDSKNNTYSHSQNVEHNIQQPGEGSGDYGDAGGD